MSFEDSEKTSRVTLQQHYNFVMNQAVSITYDLWHIIFMKILLIEDNQRTQEWVTQGLSEAGYVIDAVSDGRDGLYLKATSCFEFNIRNQWLKNGLC